MVFDHQFPPDERVQKEAQALISSEHEVYLLCIRKNLRAKSEALFDGITLNRIYIPYWIIKKLRALTNTVFNMYPHLWAYFIKRFVKRNEIEVLHIHDLYMFSSAFYAQNKSYKKIPLVGDLHENYVEGLKHYQFANSFPGNILISIKKWEKKEIEWSLKMDHILTVIEEAATRYESLGIPKNKINIVSNYVDTKEFLSLEDLPEIRAKLNEYFTLVYTGAFDLHRGLESVIKSLPELVKHCPDIRLVLVGSGKNMKDLKVLAKNLGVDQKVFFEGWQKRENLFSYIQASDICLVPHLKTVHTDNTIPHKLFQYMLLKKPVIVSDCDPLVRIVKDSNCGLIFKNNQPTELAKCVLQTYQNQNLAQEMGENGYKAVIEKYNWKTGQNQLVKLYKNIASKMMQT